MKTMIKILLMLSMVHLLSVAQSKVGTSAAPFLGMPVGARSIGMGSAFVAISSDASSTYYNPGAMSYSGISQAVISHTDWLVDTKFDWAGVIINLDGTNAFGVSFTQLNYGEDIVTTELQQNGTGEYWTASDLAIGLSYSRNLTELFSLGGTVKYIQQKIWNSSASSVALDVGLIYNTGFYGLKIGMSISNFGGDMRMDGKDLYRQIDLDPASSGINKTIVSSLKTDDWALPLIYRAGVSLDPIRSEDMRFSVAADAFRPSDNGESVNVGGEFAWKEAIFLRAGKRSLFIENGNEDYALGAGIRYELTGVNAISVNYAYQNFKIFGGIQTIELGISF